MIAIDTQNLHKIMTQKMALNGYRRKHLKSVPLFWRNTNLY